MRLRGRVPLEMLAVESQDRLWGVEKILETRIARG